MRERLDKKGRKAARALQKVNLPLAFTRGHGDLLAMCHVEGLLVKMNILVGGFG